MGTGRRWAVEFSDQSTVPSSCDILDTLASLVLLPNRMIQLLAVKRKMLKLIGNLRTRHEIQADAAGVDLRSHCPYFYEFECKLEPLLNKE